MIFQLVIFHNLIKNPVNELYILFSILFFTFYVLRIIYIMYEPDVFKYGKYVSSPIEISHIIDTTIFLNLSLFFSGLAFLFASLFKFKLRNRSYQGEGAKVKIISIYIFFIVMLLVVLFKRVFLDSGSYESEYSNISPLYKLILMFFSYSEVYLLLLLSVFFIKDSNTKKVDLLIISLLLLLFLALFTFAGKKSAILSIVLYLLLIKLIMQGDFKIHIGKFSLILFLIGCIFILGFYFGKIYRSTAFLSNENILDYNLIIYEAERWGLLISSAQELFQKISLRINAVDPLTIILNSDQKVMNLYVNSETTMQSFLNLILPGQPYEVINISRTFPLVLEESILVNEEVAIIGKNSFEVSQNMTSAHQFIDYDFAKRISTTEMWTLEGINYAHFGYYGSILSTATFIFIFSLIYSFVSQKNIRHNFLTKFVIIFMFYLFLQNFGYDNFLYYLITWPIFLISILTIHRLSSFFLPGRYIKI